MIFDGQTTCPNCSAELDWILRSVLRKADDDKTAHIDCQSCNTSLVITCRIRHHVTVTLDENP